ncbi:hypothetical protein [Nonomuraea jabiensis]|uniref:Uncharacterized protein n=1 Tax=Nonomuraea jabiensis TaxID=882448 RepID=A0A7W9G345_9ACTN|nr:hypothetical protein [Nonomuraea jabiensis]MBB5776333.1 hypothetical protein [Nonomuraea jabiensis]
MFHHQRDLRPRRHRLPRTAAEAAGELYDLLRVAGVTGPYVPWAGCARALLNGMFATWSRRSEPSLRLVRQLLGTPV